MDEITFSKWESRTYTSDDSANLQQLLFEHLCPLLIIRMLPLSVFNDLNSSDMYGQLINQGIVYFSFRCSFCASYAQVSVFFFFFSWEDITFMTFFIATCMPFFNVLLASYFVHYFSFLCISDHGDVKIFGHESIANLLFKRFIHN